MNMTYIVQLNEVKLQIVSYNFNWLKLSWECPLVLWEWGGDGEKTCKDGENLIVVGRE